jgi:hypothetical protein
VIHPDPAAEVSIGLRPCVRSFAPKKVLSSPAHLPVLDEATEQLLDRLQHGDPILSVVK